MPDARPNAHGNRAAPTVNGFWGGAPNPRRSLPSPWSCRERACSPVARTHSPVASGAALPQPEKQGRTCLVRTHGCPQRGQRRTGTPVTGVTLAHRVQADGSDVVPTGIDRTSHARPTKPNNKRSAWAGHRDRGVVARTSDFGISLRAADIMSPDRPIQLRHAGDSQDRGFLPGDPAQNHDPGAPMPQSGRRPRTTTNAQAMATSHNYAVSRNRPTTASSSSFCLDRTLVSRLSAFGGMGRLREPLVVIRNATYRLWQSLGDRSVTPRGDTPGSVCVHTQSVHTGHHQGQFHRDKRRTRRSLRRSVRPLSTFA